MNSNDLKQKTLMHLKLQLKSKHLELRAYAEELKQSLNDESKNSAGDKHETSRAMLHLEQEKIQHQWKEIEQLSKRLAQLENIQPSVKIQTGSFVKLSHDSFLVGMGMGKQLIDNQVVYCVATEAPIGKLLIGKQKGETILFNGQQQEILAVF